MQFTHFIVEVDLAYRTIVSSPDLIQCVYYFQYNTRENCLIDIACIPNKSNIACDCVYSTCRPS